MADSERIFVAKKQGFRLTKYPIPDRPKVAMWEFIAPDHSAVKYDAIPAAIDETEADIWGYLFRQYDWLGKRNNEPAT